MASSETREALIEDERAFDAPAREALLDEAFGPARFAKTSQRLRDGRLPAEGLALVARDRGELVGTVRCWTSAPAAALPCCSARWRSPDRIARAASARR